MRVVIRQLSFKSSFVLLIDAFSVLPGEVASCTNSIGIRRVGKVAAGEAAAFFACLTLRTLSVPSGAYDAWTVFLHCSHAFAVAPIVNIIVLNSRAFEVVLRVELIRELPGTVDARFV